MSQAAGSLVPIENEGSAGQSPENEDWDDVSQASWESFPASDPPAWINRPPRDPKAKSYLARNAGPPQ